MVDNEKSLSKLLHWLDQPPQALKTLKTEKKYHCVQANQGCYLMNKPYNIFEFSEAMTSTKEEHNKPREKGTGDIISTIKKKKENLPNILDFPKRQ